MFSMKPGNSSFFCFSPYPCLAFHPFSPRPRPILQRKPGSGVLSLFPPLGDRICYREPLLLTGAEHSGGEGQGMRPRQ